MPLARISQRWFSIQKYTHDYLQLVYRYYAEAGISYICTYYNLNIPDSVTDLTILDGGSYERVGELSGLLWNKILLLPIYNTETVQNTFVADERGMGKFDQITSFNFPTVYGMKPRIHDFVYFEELHLEDEHNKIYKLKSITDEYKTSAIPVYEVSHFEKATNTDITFWKVNLKISQFTATNIDKQLSGHFIFYDLQKRIYESPKGSFLFKMLERNRKLKANNFYRERCGLYFL